MDPRIRIHSKMSWIRNTAPLQPPSVSSTQRMTEKDRKLADGIGGRRGWGRRQITQRTASLALYKSFNTLWGWVSSVHPFKMRGRGDGWLVSRGGGAGESIPAHSRRWQERRDVIGIRNTSYTDCTGINCTSIWSMVAVRRIEQARESIRNDDLRTLFFVLFIY